MKLRIIFLAMALVAAFVFAGCGESDDDPITAGQAPSAPTGLMLMATSTSVHVSWTAVSGADSIIVERVTGATGGTFAVQARLSGTTTSYHDMNVTQTTTYRYKVTAKNSYGSGSSAEQTTTTLTMGTWQSDNDNLYIMQYSIAAFGDPDSALVAEITPNHTGKLTNVKVMFGNWLDGATQYQITPVAVKVITGSVTNSPAFSTTLSANQVAVGQNETGEFNWTTLDCSGSNINVTNGTSFFVTVTPMFTDYTQGSLQRLFVSGETATPSTTPVNSKLLGRDGLVTDYTGGDFAIGADYDY